MQEKKERNKEIVQYLTDTNSIWCNDVISLLYGKW
jgi:hypothetical protein